MTADEFPHTWAGRVIELAKVVGAISVLLSSAFVAWAWVYGPVAEFFDRVAALEKAASLNTDMIADLSESVKRATGEDRVIRQFPGQTYIEEPVYQGELVVMYMTAERTRLGRDCRLVDWTPLFTDVSNITVPGQRGSGGPVRRQIGDEPRQTQDGIDSTENTSSRTR